VTVDFGVEVIEWSKKAEAKAKQESKSKSQRVLETKATKSVPVKGIKAEEVEHGVSR
jgi:hypothetical protein